MRMDREDLPASEGAVLTLQWIPNACTPPSSVRRLPEPLYGFVSATGLVVDFTSRSGGGAANWSTTPAVIPANVELGSYFRRRCESNLLSTVTIDSTGSVPGSSASTVSPWTFG